MADRANTNAQNTHPHTASNPRDIFMSTDHFKGKMHGKPINNSVTALMEQYADITLHSVTVFANE
jgi:hypothetical protein